MFFIRNQQAITWRLRHLQEIQGGNHMKEKTEDKILKLPPVEVAKMHQEYGRVIQFLPSGTASCPPSKTMHEELGKKLDVNKSE